MLDLKALLICWFGVQHQLQGYICVQCQRRISHLYINNLMKQNFFSVYFSSHICFIVFVYNSETAEITMQNILFFTECVTPRQFDRQSPQTVPVLLSMPFAPKPFGCFAPTTSIAPLMLPKQDIQYQHKQ